MSDTAFGLTCFRFGEKCGWGRDFQLPDKYQFSEQLKQNILHSSQVLKTLGCFFYARKEEKL